MKLSETAIGYIPGVECVSAAVVLLAVSVFYFSLKWMMKGPVCESKASLTGKTVIITGATSGLGKEAALDLSLRGARVILVCRDVVKGHEVAGGIKSETQGELQVEQCELSSLNSVRQLAARMLETETRVDILINCGGVRYTPHWRTQDGFEYQLGVNYLAHFLLTWLLLPLMKKAAGGARIINVSCCEHRTVQLARRLEATGVSVYTANPGLTNTNLGRYTRQSSGQIVAAVQSIFYWPWLRTAQNGVQTIVYCAVEESIEDQTGLYYENCSIALPSEDAESSANALQLWKLTERIVGTS